MDADKSFDIHRSLKFDGETIQAQINALSLSDRSILMHILRCKRKLHLPGKGMAMKGIWAYPGLLTPFFADRHIPSLFQLGQPRSVRWQAWVVDGIA